MSTEGPLAGVLPVVQTLFADDGGIDLGATRRELQWILDQGVAGLTTGMVSEVLRLTDRERQELAATVVQVAAERGAISIISSGAESTRAAIAHARHAEALGATGLMAIPPVTVALDDDTVFGYFADIAAAVELPIVIQDASGYVGRPLSIDVQLRLMDALGERAYFKPEAPPIGPRLSQLRDVTGGRARVFEGTGGAALVDSYRRGVVGTMPAADVCWAVQRLWDALRASDWDAAYAISGTLNTLVSLQWTIDSFVAVEKHLLHRQGVIPNENARGPRGFELDEETRSEVDRLFEQLVRSGGGQVR